MPSELAHFYSRTRDSRKVIVVDLGFLGDTIHLVPALWELKTAYPNAQLHVLTSPLGTEVLKMAPCVDRSWSVEMQRDTRTLGEQWRVLRALRREHFDVAYNFSGADRTIFMTALTGARWRVAHPGGRRHFWNAWLIPDWIPRQDPRVLVSEQRRRMLEACGVPLGKARYDLAIDRSCDEWAAGLVGSSAIHLSPNASKPTREWPLENQAAMLGILWSKHPELTVAVSSDPQPRQVDRLESLVKRVQDPRLKVLPNKVTISQLAALLKRCRLHVGPDSGVLHLAAALDVPTVSLFRQGGYRSSFMPAGPEHRVISVPCRCEEDRGSACERLGRAECLAAIGPEQVAAVISDILRVV
ncbi:MAG TPA: glycosyltransferase family 9 protein [Verrucomicrobiae bacterium]|nr:glycosyltransferase family 9 protein [Verrucomicrobiae bacterium]